MGERGRRGNSHGKIQIGRVHAANSPGMDTVRKVDLARAQERRALEKKGDPCGAERKRRAIKIDRGVSGGLIRSDSAKMGGGEMQATRRQDTRGMESTRAGSPGKEEGKGRVRKNT